MAVTVDGEPVASVDCAIFPQVANGTLHLYTTSGTMVIFR